MVEMPETTTYLDKTRRKQVPKDEAVFFWHRVTDDAGELVTEHLGVMDVDEGEDEDKDAVDKAKHTGAMVGLWLPKQAADALAVQGGEPAEDLHLTLAYLGDASEYTPEQLQTCKACVEAWAKQYEPLTAMVSGVGRFASEPDGKDVIYASIDSYRLPGMRESLWAELNKVGVKARTNHGFTPHITLKYVGADDPYMPAPVRMAVKFDKVVFACGDTRHECAMKAEEQWETAFDIAKQDEEQRLVFGWLSVAVDKAGNTIIDSQGDTIEPADLEKAAYDFVLTARRVGEMHVRTENVGRLVESMVFTKQKAEAMGIPDGLLPQAGWWIGFKIDDPDVWAKVKSGEYRAFSVGGRGRREEVTDNAEAST